MTATLILQALFILAVIYGGLSDLASFRIPNLVSYGLVLLFIPYAIVHWATLPLLWHIGLGLGFFIPCVIFWQLGWLGAGDAKFLSAIALWMERDQILVFILATTIASIGLLFALKSLRLWNPYFQGGNFPVMFKRLLDKAEQRIIPYGAPIAFGAVLAVLS